MIHSLKTWPEYYREIANGNKTFELRKDDRPYDTGDKLILQEYNPATGKYTGEELKFNVGYVYRGTEFGLKEGYCIMSLTPYEYQP
jgi:hypothetical protein